MTRPDDIHAASHRRGKSGSLSSASPAVNMIVAIGASDGGVDACRTLLSALPMPTGLAFILVQGTETDIESRLSGLLAGIRQAENGTTLAPDNLYIVPSQTYLRVVDNHLRLADPRNPRDIPPYDFLLKSLAETNEERTICVILSGAGREGSIGLKTVRERGGLVIAQDPTDASHDGMPRNAIATGLVDLVLPVAAIPDAIIRYERSLSRRRAEELTISPPGPAEIIAYLRQGSRHDFNLNKPGVAQQRIERRMAMADLDPDDLDRYLEILQHDPEEVALLTRDLLINVTTFFRDPDVFGFLADAIVPQLVQKHPADQPLRLWVPGCSSGEEAYSLAMLFLEEIELQKRPIKLLVFASDIDSPAISIARDGFYPVTIEANVSRKRLQRFFKKEETGYRARPELRSVIVFSVSDLLTDPPFSRPHFISCRNLLTHLPPDSRARIISQFHFSLALDGILLLGNVETIGTMDDRFELVSPPYRVYRHIVRRQPGDIDIAGRAWAGSSKSVTRSSRQKALADHCTRLLTETLSSTSVLINRNDECLYFMGNVDRYLWMTPGQPTLDIFALAHRSVRPKLRAALQQARLSNDRVLARNVRFDQQSGALAVSIDIRPTQIDGEELWFICIREEEPDLRADPDHPAEQQDHSRIAALERELETTRHDLESTIHNLEIAAEEQRVAYEEILSANAEFQSINEELLISKEEQQSRNEKLAALNNQLQDSLNRQGATSNNLQNVLYSTGEAIFFLDSSLHIRFFTPATRALFNVLPGDIGRPLEDLSPLVADPDLLSDALLVMTSGDPRKRKVQGRDGFWFVRRILPYRRHDGRLDGIVITFTDITELKQAADGLEAMRQQAEEASLAKSRFLAAASHDLRQPLQTLALLQALLAKMVDGAPEQRLVNLLNQTLIAMSGMLNTLRDINQIDTGIVDIKTSQFSIGALLERLRDEFQYHAEARGLALRVVDSSAEVCSDMLLLDQMIRNLLTNALKYTEKGKILLGCRRRGEKLSIEVWDTGIGIPESEMNEIFQEYHQVDSSARDRQKGLGLGLTIVQRIGALLGHHVQVHSEYGRGSVFFIELDRVAAEGEPPVATRRYRDMTQAGAKKPPPAMILVIEDDREVRDLLTLFLLGESHQVTATNDGTSALNLVKQNSFRPDVIITDYYLPNGQNGLQVIKALRDKFLCDIPAILLTGDLAVDPLRGEMLPRCQQLQKPVKARELSETIGRLRLPPIPPLDTGRPRRHTENPIIFIVDDDDIFRQMLRETFEAQSYLVEDYRSGEDFLANYAPGGQACLLVDAYLPGISGIDLLERIKAADIQLPAIVVTGKGDISTAVQAMNAGAMELIEKPASPTVLLASVARAVAQARSLEQRAALKASAAETLARLTPRQHQILELILCGMPNKLIAVKLNISQRTVENHRAEIMKKTGAASLPELARLALAANWGETKTVFLTDPAPF